MAASKRESSSFARIWQAALDDYYGHTKLHLDDPAIPVLDDAEDAIKYLQGHDREYRNDTRGSAFSDALKGAIGPFNFLTSTVGGAAGMVFPGASQVLGAVVVLVNASKATTGAFDAIKSLFDDLRKSTKRMAVVSRERIPESMEDIYQAMLVTLLNVIALATKKTFHRMRLSKGDQPDWYIKLKQKAIAPTLMHVTEYAHQLFQGGDAEIDGAVGFLKQLVEEESRMMEAVTLKTSMTIERKTFQIEGLAVSISAVVERIDLKMDRANVSINEANIGIDQANAGISTANIGVDKANVGIDKTNVGVDKLNSGMEDVKEYLQKIEKRIVSREDAVVKQQEDRLSRTGQLGKQGAGGSKSEAAKELKTADRISDILKPAKANMENYERYRSERIKSTADWVLDTKEVKSWIDRQCPILWIHGDSGFGKTFLASRIIEALQEQYRQGVQDPSRVSVVYFFCRNLTEELRSVGSLLRTTAFQVALNDQAYAKQVLSGVANASLPGDDDIGGLWRSLYQQPCKAAAESQVYMILDAVDECPDEQTEALITALQDIAKSDTAAWPCNLRILFLSKADAGNDMASAFGDGFAKLVLDGSMNAGDITLLVQEKMRKTWKGKLINKQIYEEVRALVPAQAEGNFLWASLVVEQLSSLSREDVVRTALRSLRKGLPFAMLLTLKRLSRELDGDDLEDLNDILAWVICAHRELSLAEIDALLYLRKPGGARIIDLEDRLRGELGSLFVVSGLETLSEAVLQEQIHRRLLEDPTTATDAFLNTGGYSEGTSLVDGDRTTTDQQEDFGEGFMKRRLAAMAGINVRLLHSRVAEYIQDSEVAKGLIGFETATMRSRVLLWCLDAICATNEEYPNDVLRVARGYCCLLLPEHLSDLSPSQLEPDTKLAVALRLLKLLRNRKILDQWTSVAEDWMTDDLLLSQSPGFVSIVHSFLSDPDVRSQQSEEEQQWVTSGFKAPLRTYMSSVARSIAKRWLQTRSGNIDSQFRFLNAFVTLVSKEAATVSLDGAQPAAGDHQQAVGSAVDAKPLAEAVHNEQTQADDKAAETSTGRTSGGPAESQVTGNHAETVVDPSNTADKTPDYSLENVSVDRILEVARWAGFEENALWYSCLGATIRDAGRPADAATYYQKAVELDSEDALILAGMALNYGKMEDTEKAIVHLKSATELFERNIAEGRSSLDPDWNLESRYYWYLQELAWYCLEVKRYDEAVHSHEATLANWEHTDPESGDWSQISMAAVNCADTFVLAERFDLAADMLQRFLEHPKRLEESFVFVYEQLLERDILLRIAKETRRYDVLEKLYANALQTFARYGSNGSCSAVRYHRAIAIVRFHPEQHEAACKLLRWVLADPEISNMSSSWYYLREVAELALARLYFERILQAREDDQWSDVGTYAQELVNLVRGATDDDGKATFSTRNSSLILAAWDRVNGRMDRAKQCARGMLQNGFAMLSDTDPDNDSWAWVNIGDAVLAVGDTGRVRAADGFLRMLTTFGAGTAETTSASAPLPLGDAVLAENGANPQDSKMTNEGVGEGQAVPGAERESPALFPVLGADVEDRDSKPQIAFTSKSNGTSPPVKREVLFQVLGVESEEEGADGNLTIDAVLEEDEGVVRAQNPSGVGTEANATDTRAEPANNEETATWYICDGPCFKSIPNKDSMWRCSYCISDLCESCHGLIKEGKTDNWAICGRLHEHFQIPGIKSRYAPGMIMVGEEEEPITKWLSDLKDEWGIK